MSTRRLIARRHGFTLIEVLAALALTVMVIVALTLAVGVVSGAWGRGGRTVELDEAVSRAASRFHDDVASLVPWRYVEDNGGVVAFDGGRSAVLFAGVVRTGAYGSPRLRLVRYRVISDDRGFEVERSTAIMPNDPRRLSGVWTGAVAIVAGVDRPEFAFAAPTLSGRVWRETWPAGPALPTAIRLSFATGGRVFVIEAPVQADPFRDCLIPNADLACGKQTGTPAGLPGPAPQNSTAG